MEEMSIENPGKWARFARALRLKCPNCGKASVFYPGKYRALSRPQMHEVCESCGYRFHQEEGYFRGAVYLSYGLLIVEGLLAFLLARFLIFGLSLTNQILIALCAMLFMAYYNYKFARIVWLGRDDVPPPLV